MFSNYFTASAPPDNRRHPSNRSSSMDTTPSPSNPGEDPITMLAITQLVLPVISTTITSGVSATNSTTLSGPPSPPQQHPTSPRHQQVQGMLVSYVCTCTKCCIKCAMVVTKFTRYYYYHQIYHKGMHTQRAKSVQGISG